MGASLLLPWSVTVATLFLWLFHVSCRSSMVLLSLWARSVALADRCCSAEDDGLPCSWLYMKVSWWARVTLPMTSSSPLSVPLDEEDEFGLVSIGTEGSRSASVLDSDWLLHGEEPGEEEEVDVGEGSSTGTSTGQGGDGLPRGAEGVWVPWSWLWSWLLFIMLFIALCISRSIRCFSRLGMRPKRTAGEQKSQLQIHLSLSSSPVYNAKYSLLK